MVARRESPANSGSPRRRPATTPRARENQLIAQAYNLAEEQIVEGTVSAQVLTHFIKAGSMREKLEQLKIQHENDLLQARSEAIAAAARTEEMYKEAMDAMRGYAGMSRDDDRED